MSKKPLKISEKKSAVQNANEDRSVFDKLS